MKATDMAKLPKNLWQCDTKEEQIAWCKAQLEAGKTLTDPGIFLAGAEPDRIIRTLRRRGMPIKTCYVKTVDAGGNVHSRTLAWRLPTKAEASPAESKAAE